MSHPAAPGASSATALHAALLEFFGAPGKYQLALRQPPVLFASVREILQIAAGRSGGEAGTEAGPVRQAAAFFIRAALLYPGADYYTVFGLPQRSEPVELKERYRLLMRLIHPDFASATAPEWPADAAVQVNRAYEVLSSAVLRQDYDEQLQGRDSPRAVPPAAEMAAPVPLVRTMGEPSLRGRSKAAWVLAACAATIGGLALLPRQEPVQLVQRSVGPPMVGALPEPGASRAAAADVEPAGAGAAQPAPLPAVQHQPKPPQALPAVLQATLPPLANAPSAVATPAAAAQAAVQKLAVAPPPVAAVPAGRPVEQARTPVALASSPGEPVRRSESMLLPGEAGAPSPGAGPVTRVVQVAAPGPAPVAVPVPVAAMPPTPAAAPAVAPAVAPAAIAPAAIAPAPAVVARAPAPPSPAPVAAIAATTAPVASGPTLGDVQPLLSQLLQTMESGSGEQLLRLLEPDARHTAAALALSREYEQAVRGARPVRLTNVEFRGESREGVLLVVGRMRLHASNGTIGSHGDPLLVRAEFVSRGGRVHLTRLSGGLD